MLLSDYLQTGVPSCHLLSLSSCGRQEEVVETEGVVVAEGWFEWYLVSMLVLRSARLRHKQGRLIPVGELVLMSCVLV